MAGLTSVFAPIVRAPNENRERKSDVVDVRAATAPDGSPLTRPLTRRERRIESTADTPSVETLPRGLHPDVAARAIVRVTAAERYQQFLDERNELVTRELNGSLTTSDARRLEFLRWQIDRIEDALDGDHLDRLEVLVEQHEMLGSRVRELMDKLERASSTALKPRSKKR